VQVYVGLEKSPIGNIPLDFDELQNLFSLVQFEKAILRRLVLLSSERPPNLVEAGSYPGTAQFSQRTEGILTRGKSHRRSTVRNISRYRAYCEIA
jgi:hypothetical protein